MTMSPLSRLLRHTDGVAAAEMALVTPLLLTLMFGSFELGNYFLSEHVVVKSVRDGARYAGRLSFTEYDCSAPSSNAIDQIRNVTRTGQVASGGTERLTGWTSPTTITVSVACSSTTTGGIYKDKTGGAPVVTVSASVPYSSLLGTIGLANPSLTLNAKSQSAVNGI
jgi:Flp pilus assembly protein TadG